MANEPAHYEWVLCPWFVEHGTESIHTQDVQTLRRLAPYGKVFSVVGTEGDFVRLAYGQEVVRVRRGLLKEVPAPAFQIGQSVLIKRKNRPALVEEVQWHQQKRKPFFLLRVDGRTVSTRYWEEDLVPCRPSDANE